MLRHLLLLACSALALVPLAQAAETNRRLSDVRIVHPPGSAPGTWQVLATVDAIIGAGAPIPAVLDMELTLELNGVVIGTGTIPLGNVNGPSCSQAECNTGQFCAGWFNGVPSLTGFCYTMNFSGGNYICGCMCQGVLWDFGTHGDLRTTDVITVTLNPTPGSLAEVETSDDSITLPVPENPIGTPYCSGDGTTSTACPCSNFGAPGNGCANSVNPAGAHLAAFGWTQDDAITGTDSVVLHGSGMPATSTAIYLKGSGSTPGGILFGDGLRCASGTLIRLRTKINVGGASKYPEAGEESLSLRGGTPPGTGVTAYYQVYYRNPDSFCTELTFNISNAVALEW